MANRQNEPLTNSAGRATSGHANGWRWPWSNDRQPHEKTRRAPKKTRGPGEKTQRGVLALLVALLVSALVLSGLLWFCAPESVAERAAAIGLMAFVVFVAAGAAGALLGFLFGLPRARLTDQAEGGMSAGAARLTDQGEGKMLAGAARLTAPASVRYLSNSNLTKVSDWLTTIVVGLGLVNLPDALPTLQKLANAVAGPLGGPGYAGAMGLPLMITGSLSGFLLCYVWTSLRLRELFEESESDFETVPDLRDRSLGQAKVELGMTSMRLAPPDGVTDDTAVIIDQDIRPGDRVPTGTRIPVSTRGTASKPPGQETLTTPEADSREPITSEPPPVQPKPTRGEA